MTSHTPGPWFVGGETDHGEILICSDARPTICAVDPGAREWCTQANARLIAAAPDLLDALQSILPDAVANHVGGPDTELRINSARAAITKATGRIA